MRHYLTVTIAYVHRVVALAFLWQAGYAGALCGVWQLCALGEVCTRVAHGPVSTAARVLGPDARLVVSSIDGNRVMRLTELLTVCNLGKLPASEGLAIGSCVVPRA